MILILSCSSKWPLAEWCTNQQSVRNNYHSYHSSISDPLIHKNYLYSKHSRQAYETQIISDMGQPQSCKAGLLQITATLNLLYTYFWKYSIVSFFYCYLCYTIISYGNWTCLWFQSDLQCDKLFPRYGWKMYFPFSHVYFTVSIHSAFIFKTSWVWIILVDTLFFVVLVHDV